MLDMLLLKLKYLLHYYKSKSLKKKCKVNYSKEKIDFIDKISDKNFSNKWFLNNFEIFNYFLPENKNEKFNYLEIGCYEGLSSFYVLSQFKFVNAYFLDIWAEPNKNSESLTGDFNKVEKFFDKNLSRFNFTKIKDDSVISMRKLFRNNLNFDFIYIDGSHNGEDILSDAIEAFKILKKGGLIFFDDFLQYEKNRKIQSYVGIEKFLELYSNDLQIVFFQNNLAVKKI
ncbi:class I SAM-dependent methyltransferase [Candidatus Pelagibacter sp.]|nr:class I SAM-dependent methyltransferase [Candidatus Pelagibacter sp.]